jgi:hypothetical protein
MSRTREGRDKESNETTRQQAEPQPTTENTLQPGGARQSAYIPGRESTRDFPRRSTSFRESNYSQSRDLYGSRREDTSRQGRTGSYRNRPAADDRSSRGFEQRPEDSPDYRGYYRQRTNYADYGRGSQPYSESRGRQTGHDEDRERYGRGRVEGRPSRAYDQGRDFDYDRERGRQRSLREDYDEPYQREAQSDRYGYEQEYWPARARPGVGRYTGDAE